ncbi:MAG: V-type ATP synthase subunit A [Candidatus Bathyarchaeota archaeon]|nr:V-type ATP synthase subunit A [Candidatus Bathyarchaeota archaeon]
MSSTQGRIKRINGSLVVAEGLSDAKIGDVIHIGSLKLIGEVVRIAGKDVSIQCYEDTSGIRPGEPIFTTELPLVAELGPGLMGGIFDGLEFSETEIWNLVGPFMKRGVKVNPLNRKKKWDFTPKVKKGDKVIGGDIIGSVQETSVIEHRILIPPTIGGKIFDIKKGDYTITDNIATVQMSNGKKKDITMMQVWPVRIPRPYKSRIPSTEPLITGQRVVDSFFPIAKGGAAAIPGGFGTGKTVTLHQLAKWSEAQIIIYIGCGERGNEMADVVTHFPTLKDPRTGKQLIERSIFIANVSNLPVSAREASIYMGVTMGEYFRDQGYDVAIMADSTSRWAEALRDISGRLEEIPAERGYPAYLAERIAEFYERGGTVITLGSKQRVGSITIMGAVSPPGGDFSEPVTSISLRFVGTLWALDTNLAFRRHFPAINWLMSFSRYTDLLVDYWSKFDPDWLKFRDRALALLEEASKIEETARIIGEKALPDEQRLVLLISEMIREGFLVQNAYHEVDAFCEAEKQAKILRLFIEFYEMINPLIKAGVPIDKIREFSSIVEIMRLKERKGLEWIDKAKEKAESEVDELAKQYEILS